MIETSVKERQKRARGGKYRETSTKILNSKGVAVGRSRRCVTVGAVAISRKRGLTRNRHVQFPAPARENSAGRLNSIDARTAKEDRTTRGRSQITARERSHIPCIGGDKFEGVLLLKRTRPDTRQYNRRRLGRSSDAKTAHNSKILRTDRPTGQAVYPRFMAYKKDPKELQEAAQKKSSSLPRPIYNLPTETSVTTRDVAKYSSFSSSKQSSHSIFDSSSCASLLWASRGRMIEIGFARMKINGRRI